MGVEVKYVRFPIPDVSVPEDPSVMASVLDAIDAAQHQRPIVYVHCWGGIGRTGTVVGCYFRGQGQSGDGALAQVAHLWTGVEKSRRRPESPETDEQRAYVRAWETLVG